jgi:hypothetical protein
MRLYTKPTSAPAINQPPCNAASNSEFESSILPSGVSSWIRALTVGKNIQKPIATRMFMA